MTLSRKRPPYQYAELQRLFEPNTIALVGASPKEGVAQLALRNLRNFPGRVRLVNAKYPEVAGQECYPSINSLPETPDCVILATPREAVGDVIDECIARGVGGAVVFASGFAETGHPERAAEQANNAGRAARGGVRLLGPNSVGFINHRMKFAASFTPELAFSEGNGPCIGLVSQSGGVGNGLTQALRRGIPFSHTLSPGNSSDVDCADCISYLAMSPHCSAIAVVIEGLESPARLLDAARIAQVRNKPLIMFKLGRGRQGAKAALSHSGFVAGAPEAFDAALRSAGAVIVDRLEALIETATFFAKAPVATPGGGIAVISASGGTVVHAADEAERHQVPLPPMSEALAERISQLVPAFANIANPLDLTSSPNGPQRLLDCAEAMLADPRYAAVVAPHVYSFGAESRKFDELGALAARAGKPVVINWISEWTQGDGSTEGHRNPNVAVFRSTSDAFAAIDAWLRRSRDRENPAVPYQRLSSANEAAQAGRLIEAAQGNGLTEREAQRVLQHYGIPVAAGQLARTADEAVAIARTMGGPVAVKIESPDLLHKTEAGGVRLGCGTDDEVRKAFEEVMANARAASPEARLAGVLVQPMIAPGAEILVGGRVDPQFGPQVLAGVGGTVVELVRDVVVAPAPISPQYALKMLERLRAQALLDGYRGFPAVDRDALAAVIARTSELLADQSHRITELDINPLICRGASILAVDALITLVKPNEEEISPS